VTFFIRYVCFTRYFVLQFTAIYDEDIAADSGRQFIIISQADATQAAFYLLYALHVLCLASAKLMVLDGLTQYAQQRVPLTSTSRLPFKVLRVSNTAGSVIVCMCNIIGLFANCVAAYFFSQGADLEAEAARKYLDGDVDANATVSRASLSFTRGNAANSIQNYSEALVLVIINVVFFFAVVIVVRILRAVDSLASFIVQQSNESNLVGIRQVAAAVTATGSRMRSRITATVGVCIATLLLRSCWAIVVAVSQSGYHYNPDCGQYPAGQCSSCQPEAVAIRFTLFFSPEVQMIVETISGPLALCFALWGMTNDRDRKMLYGT
jgi:hypothetical protein